MNARAAIVSIGVGEGMVVAYHFKALPTFGTLPVVWVVCVTTAILIGGSLLRRPQTRRAVSLGVRMARRTVFGWAAAFGAIFALAQDVWAWGDARLWLLGFPGWVWASAGLCVLTSLAFAWFGRRAGSTSV
jgi:hypothetical protein